VRTGYTAGEATDTPENEGFSDEEDAAWRHRCKRGGKGLRGERAYGAKGNEEEKEGQLKIAAHL
jgi:hypothetical protein